MISCLFPVANPQDRFGNFIGEEAESDQGSDHGVNAGNYVYDDESVDEHVPSGQELMEIDGRDHLFCGGFG